MVEKVIATAAALELVDFFTTVRSKVEQNQLVSDGRWLVL